MMDTSEQYIKMCDWPRIQEQRTFKDDYYCELREGIVYNHNNVLYVEGEKCIWLPRQGQLQEMSRLDWRSFDRKCLVYEHPVLVPTKEQAGIRVVMHENHNKEWGGEKWTN